MSLLISALKRLNKHKTTDNSCAHNAFTPSSTPKRMNVTDTDFPMHNNKRRACIALIPLIISGTLFTGGYYAYRETTTEPQDDPYTTTPIPAPQATTPAALIPPIVPSPSAPSAHKRRSAAHSAKKLTDTDLKKTTRLPAPQAIPMRLTDLHSGPEENSVDSLLATAYAAYQNGDYATANKSYLAALEITPQNRDALLGLAVISQQQGKDAASANYYRQVLAIDPRDPLAHAGLASFDGSDRSSRENHLKRLISHHPEEAALHLALGHLYAEQSRWSDAQQAYFNALTMDPGNVLFAFNLAVSLDHLGQYRDAAKHYRQALDRAPSGSPGFDRFQAERRLDQLNMTVN